MDALIHIYTGEGKGKTTAAIGLALRMAGSRGRVLIAQFLKDGSSAELIPLEKIEGIDLIRYPYPVAFLRRMNREELLFAREKNREYFEKITACCERYDMLLLDEFCAAYRYELIDRESALNFLRNKPRKLELVLTGRDADPELIELADYVSEIRKIKHPFDRGISARRGIEL